MTLFLFNNNTFQTMSEEDREPFGYNSDDANTSYLKAKLSTDRPPHHRRELANQKKLRADLERLGATESEKNQVVEKMFQNEFRHREGMEAWHPYNAQRGLNEVRRGNDVWYDWGSRNTDLEFPPSAQVHSREIVTYVPERLPYRNASTEAELEPIRRMNNRIMQKAGLGPVGERFRQRRQQIRKKMDVASHLRQGRQLRQSLLKRKRK
jgi:hypothetical protein